MTRADPDTSKYSRFILLASVCVIIAGLYLAQQVLVPLVLAMLLSFLLAPLANRLERVGMPRIISVCASVVVALALVGAIGYVLYNQVGDLAEELPSYRGNILAKIDRFGASGGGVIRRMKETADDVSKRIDAATPQTSATTTQTTQSARITSAANAPSASAPPTTPPRPLGSSANPMWVVSAPHPQPPIEQLESALIILLGPLGTAGVVLVITIFMLLARENLRDRAIRLIGRGQITVTTQALDDAATRISRYLVMQTLINAVYGTVIAIGLWIIGVPNPLLFGMLCGVLRFIPYIGPWIGAAFPLLISLARFPGSAQFVETLALFIVWELVTNNVLEPWLYGASTGLSSVAVIVAAVFWTWLWGPVGLLLSTPLTVVLIVVGKYVPRMQFLGILLGDEPVLSPGERLYQRLLALDSEESIELVHEFRKEMSLEEVYDTVILPALAQSEQDRHRGALDERRRGFLRQTFREIIEELGDAEQQRRADGVDEPVRPRRGNDNGSPATPKSTGRPPETSASVPRMQVPKDAHLSVVCLPAADEADELCGLILAQLLNLRGYTAFSVPETKLASEMLGAIDEKRADVAVVSALPPAAVAHARYLCKRMRTELPETKVIVGLWTYSGSIEKARDRITCVASAQLATSLKQAQDAIDQVMLQKLVAAAPSAPTSL